MRKKSVSKFIAVMLIAAVWFTIDRVVKRVVAGATVGDSISGSVLGIFHITYVKNTGAAFGSFQNGTIVLSIVSVLLICVLLGIFLYGLYLEQNGRLATNINLAVIIPLGLVVGGGLGNMYDRIAYGFVTDYICLDFTNFPVFNIADIGVTCGVLFLLVYMLVSMFIDKKKDTN